MAVTYDLRVAKGPAFNDPFATARRRHRHRLRQRQGGRDQAGSEARRQGARSRRAINRAGFDRPAHPRLLGRHLAGIDAEERLRRHRPEVAAEWIDNLLAIVDQRSHDRKQPQRRQWSSGKRLPIRCGTLINRMRIAGSQTRPGAATACANRQRLQAAEPALAAAERGERFGEIGRVEVGPHPVGEMQFGIGALPQQEVGQPLSRRRCG